MSTKQYATVVGFVQAFPNKPVVTEREISGVGTVHEFLVRAVGFAGQPLVKVTLWPEYAHVATEISKGDFVAADGVYSQNTGNDGKVYHNLSASSGLAILSGETKEASEARAVVNAVQTESTAAPF